SKNLTRRSAVILCYSVKNSEYSRCYSAIPICKKRGIPPPNRPTGCLFLSITAKTTAALGAPPHAVLLVDRPVELPGVLAGDLVDDFGGQARELFLDVFRGFRPHPVGVRVVGAPHQGLDADVVDELGADRVELERR